MSSVQTDGDIRLDQLARLTGLSPVLIRAWERRYGVPAPSSRTQGGHRRYSREQAELVRRAAVLVRTGLRAADAIARVRAEAGETQPPDRLEAAGLADLLVSGDAVPALLRLREAWLTVGLETALESLVLPALREVGAGWEDGRYSVADEHVATGVVMSWLGGIRSELPPPAAGPPAYLIATPEGEHHELAVWALELLLRRRAVPALALGGSVPAADLASEAERLRPAGVVLAIARPGLRRSAVGAGRTVTEATDGRVAIYLGGAGAPARATGMSILPRSLTAAADLLAGPLRSSG